MCETLFITPVGEQENGNCHEGNQKNTGKKHLFDGKTCMFFQWTKQPCR